MLYNVIPEEMFLMRPGPRCTGARPRFLQEPAYNIGLFRDFVIPTSVPRHRRERVASECSEHGKPQCVGRRCVGPPWLGRRCPLNNKAGSTAAETKPERKTTKFETLDFRGFAPEEIKVKVTDKTVVISGRKESPRGTCEVKRSVRLPSGAEKTGIVCKYVDGLVILEQVASVEPIAERKPEKTEDAGRKHVEDRRDCCCKSGESDCNSEETEAREAFEETMKNLSGIFSTLFGVPEMDSDDGAEMENTKAATEEKERELPVSQEATEKKETTMEQMTEKADMAGSQSEAMTNEYDEARETRTETDTGLKLDDDEQAQTCRLTYEDKPALENMSDDFIYVENTDREACVEEDRNERHEVSNEEPKREIIPEDETFPDSTHTGSDNVVITDVTDVEPEFEVALDLSNYKPENIRVICREGDVTVEAEREIEDGYSGTETVSRCIKLPENVDVSRLSSILNAQGSMSIKAPFLTATKEQDNDWNDIPVVVQ